MGHIVVEVLAAFIVIAALWLAARYPKAFGFFGWEFGVSWIEDESHSDHYLRAFRYWTSVCTFGALFVGVAYLAIDREKFEYSDGFFHFFAPLVIGSGYLRSMAYFALHIYYKRREAQQAAAGDARNART